MKLSPGDTEVLRTALALLAMPEHARGCEPLAVLSHASKGLEGSNGIVDRIHKLEREFSGNGALWNHAERRLASLGAVLRFYGA